LCLTTKFTLTLTLTINDPTTLSLTVNDPQNAYEDIFSAVDG